MVICRNCTVQDPKIEHFLSKLKESKQRLSEYKIFRIKNINSKKIQESSNKTKTTYEVVYNLIRQQKKADILIDKL